VLWLKRGKKIVLPPKACVYSVYVLVLDLAVDSVFKQALLQEDLEGKQQYLSYQSLDLTQHDQFTETLHSFISKHKRIDYCQSSWSHKHNLSAPTNSPFLLRDYSLCQCWSDGDTADRFWCRRQGAQSENYSGKFDCSLALYRPCRTANAYTRS
jgi:hypothetical protein